jgi:hypothetical protein
MMTKSFAVDIQVPAEMRVGGPIILDCGQGYSNVTKAIWTDYIRLKHASVKCDAF